MPRAWRTRQPGTELRKRLEHDREIPDWFTYPEVARELRRSRAPRREQGFTAFMSGLSGSGKSTVANALLARVDRPVRALREPDPPVQESIGALERPVSEHRLASRAGANAPHRRSEGAVEAADRAQEQTLESRAAVR